MADFFDKMKDGFNKGVATVSAGSKAMIEKTKIYAVIKGLEDEKKQLIEILGNKIYKLCMETEEGDIPREEVISFCKEISSREEQIEAQKKKIEELEKEMNQTVAGSANVCRCGYTNSENAKFCEKCGNKLS